ncbi:MAG: ADP-forming succinate--CoA ligase subunit beta [Flavobacteriales bacterium]|nr:ADP-forming succinate--CoA ligase subunit beta [Flavobacteriales bacterium]MCW8913000.1 ADP-forming succinate--CoA ligase subunit beta [Flavobacteriales bacterium]MCW8938600.1 ADP-forming succinate--CoA ligase subunit beta [Flavobacteriales bacterium]MCW8989001.1 ADP-forming succinate--CoA ligase subunit beta [Flavobacteriales bacterium]MCW9021199.1 ADP-forming succinate--CoA ligase subunit beta [Flavobacteriales bacterium]
MNIHEYQGKSLLKKYGVAIQEGVVADTPEQAVEAAKEVNRLTGSEWFVVKAQIHAGGRGKGVVTETGSHGVVLAKGLDKVHDIAKGILGGHLVTKQTKAEGKLVNKVLIAQDVYYPGEAQPEEFYMSVLMNRETGRNIIMYSPEGGMDIEAVAEKTPELIFKEEIDPKIGLQGFQARRIAFNLDLSGEAFKQMVKFVFALYAAYEGTDAAMFEINPVLKTSDNKIIAVDSKVSIDESALFRHKDIAEMRDISEEDPVEVEAKKAGLNYVNLDGNVGCMVNGAGLAMATMDIIKLSGGEPANFLDVGGTADAERVEKAFRMILKDDKVEAILVNIFGGIVRCDRVAQGVVDAYKNIGDINVPIIVRLQGTNAEEAKKLIDDSGLKVHSAVLLKEAADKVKEVLA